MSCCAPTILPFASVTSLTTAWDAAKVAAYGAEPHVQVYILDPDTDTYVKDNGIPISSISFDGVNIFCDFGGPATGVVILN